MGDLPTGTVTFLFSDIEGSAHAWERGGDEMEVALARHDELLRGAVDDHDGVVVKWTGDGVMAVFADAGEAVEAAVSAQRAITTESWPTPEPLRVRMGIHTGAADERGGDYVGMAPTRAARVTDAAHGGQVLVSGATAGLLESEVDLLDLGEHPLKGLGQPERLHQVVASGLDRAFPPPRTARLARHNLPPERNRFVGRDEELAAVRKALESGRLTTLTGVGGCGKTRLAVEVARGEVERFPDGVYLVDLTTVSDEDLVASAVLTALSAPPDVTTGRSPREGLLAYLGRQHLLLVLDNCEHLVEGCAELVDELIDVCPDVAVLATSREALEVEGERAYRVPSLGMPSDDGPVLASDAARLFVERAVAVRPGFDASGEHEAPIGEICRRLDGIPLAIELAAARVSHLSPVEIAERLDDRFRLLTGRQRRRVQRQQTLEATLDWSWELLDDDERVLLGRLAVFPGRFGLEAVEGICGFGAATVDLMGSLVGKSLVVALDDHGTPGYRMLESVRLYAQQRLLESGEAEELRGRHREWFSAWAASVMDRNELGPLSAVRAALVEQDDVRAAIEWALSEGALEQAVPLLALAIAGGSYPGLGSSMEEEGAWVATLVERREELPRPVAAEVVARAAVVSMWQARFDEMRERSELAIELAGDEFPGIVPVAFTLRGLRAIFEDPERARADIGRGIEAASRPEQMPARLMGEVIGAGVDLVVGEIDGAIAVYESVLEAYADREPDPAVWMASAELALASLVSDRPDATRRVLALVESPAAGSEATATTVDFGASARLMAEIRLDGSGDAPAELLELTRDQLRFDVPLGSLVALNAWVELALAQGDFERAAELLGVQRAQASVDGWRSPAQLPLYRAQVARVRSHLDSETARAARDRGGRWRPDEALQRELERAEGG